MDQSLEAAYTNRPEMKALLHDQRQVELRSNRPAKARYPTLSFDGYLVGTRIDAADGHPGLHFRFLSECAAVYRRPHRRPSAPAPIWNCARYPQQEQEQRNQIALQVRTAIAQMAAARNEVDVANQAVGLANEEVTQARDRFQAGVANNIEVITAQDALARANDNQIVALYRYNQARADLARATGQMEAVYAK